MKIGILGSAFDPPHLGHLILAERAGKVLTLDRVILMPTKTPPHKNTPVASPRFRLQMARLVAEKKRGWLISDMELLRSGTSYTRDTIAALKKRYPRAELFWMIGSDGLVSMPWKWKGGYDILDCCRFVVMRRKGFSLSRVSRRILKKVIVLPGRTPGISSTFIRTLFLEGRGKDARWLLDRKVFRFIERHKLYHNNSGAR